MRFSATGLVCLFIGILSLLFAYFVDATRENQNNMALFEFVGGQSAGAAVSKDNWPCQNWLRLSFLKQCAAITIYDAGNSQVLTRAYNFFDANKRMDEIRINFIDTKSRVEAGGGVYSDQKARFVVVLRRN